MTETTKMIKAIANDSKVRIDRIVANYEQLEKENAELKERADKADLDSVLFFNQLCKAKEIIKELYEGLDKLYLSGLSDKQITFVEQLQDKAEQFLRETNIDNAIQKANEGLNLDKIAEEIEQDIKEQSNS